MYIFIYTNKPLDIQNQKQPLFNRLKVYLIQELDS